MAYNFYAPYPQMFPNQQVQPQMQAQVQPQIQNGGFMIVKSEQEVLNYPVGCGNSVNFKIENAPYLYTKTMGFSQFDKPVIEKYRLVKEETQEPKIEDPVYQHEDELKNEINKLWEEVNKLKEGINDELGV